MRASSVRSHHSSVRTGRERALHGDTLARELGERPSLFRSRQSRGVEASAPVVTGPSASRRLRTTSTSAPSAFPDASREFRGRVDRRWSLRVRIQRVELRQPFGGDPQRLVRGTAGHDDARRAARRRKLLEKREPAFVRLRFRAGHETEAEQRVVQLVRVVGFRPRFSRARARSPRHRAGRGPLPTPRRASGAP